jgi:tRNA(Leu) C34 or U34 (ribose-2'-O)-methylase TrmL
MTGAAVALVNPKFHRNVGNALRACSNFNAGDLRWTPERIPDPADWLPGEKLPREERMKLYQDVSIKTFPRHTLVDDLVSSGYTPVAVEVRENAEPLPWFEHPDKAVYVFGPEDGSLDRGILTACHRFVVIPSASCLNLAAAVNVILYDRISKAGVVMNPANTRAYQEVES